MTGDEDLEDEAAATAQADLALRRDLIAFQRRTLSDLRQQGRIGVTTLRSIEHDLDLEEARLPPAEPGRVCGASRSEEPGRVPVRVPPDRRDDHGAVRRGIPRY